MSGLWKTTKEKEEGLHHITSFTQVSGRCNHKELMMTGDPLDHLAERVRLLLTQSGVAEQVSMAFRMLVDVRRLELKRRTSVGTRYLLITPIDPELLQQIGWDFALMGGLEFAVDPMSGFDSRYGGTEENILIAIKTWLVDLGPWGFPIPR